MNIATNVYSHREGEKVVSRAMLNEIALSLPLVDSAAIRGATSTRTHLVGGLRRKHGWSNEVVISHKAKVTITSCKDKIGLCVQTGNMARIYADLMKLSLLHTLNRIRGAVYVLATQELAKKWGSNIANYRRLVNELEIFEPILHVPLVVLAISDRVELKL